MVPHEDETDGENRETAMGRAFAQEKGLGQYETEFAKGAQVAQDPLAFESLDMLNDEDKAVLRREVVSFFFFFPFLLSNAHGILTTGSSLVRRSQTHKWDHPKMLYFLVICCSMCAAVQGMVSGAPFFTACRPLTRSLFCFAG